MNNQQLIIHIIYLYIYSINFNMGIGDWGLGIGDWGLGIGDWGQYRVPNPQSPSPQPIF